LTPTTTDDWGLTEADLTEADLADLHRLAIRHPAPLVGDRLIEGALSRALLGLHDSESAFWRALLDGLRAHDAATVLQ
jgi:hypothetical protein